MMTERMEIKFLRERCFILEASTQRLAVTSRVRLSFDLASERSLYHCCCSRFTITKRIANQELSPTPKGMVHVSRSLCENSFFMFSLPRQIFDQFIFLMSRAYFHVKCRTLTPNVNEAQSYMTGRRQEATEKNWLRYLQRIPSGKTRKLTQLLIRTVQSGLSWRSIIVLLYIA